MTDIISITESAQVFIKNIFDANPNTSLVVGYSNAGCSGHKYTFALCDDAEIPLTSEFVSISDSGRVVILPDSILGLTGATLDLRVEDFGEQLIWHNPNSVNSCGCGDSFQLSDEEGCG